jgi:hypothetical protein
MKRQVRHLLRHFGAVHGLCGAGQDGDAGRAAEFVERVDQR